MERFTVLQKEQFLSAGKQPEFFQGRGGFMELEHFDKHFVKNTRREDLAEKHFGDTPKVHFEWKI